MKLWCQRRTSQQRLPTARSGRATGQALVEMALVVLLMITLAVAIIDFGVYMYRFVQTGNCVREAARRASVHDPNAGAGDESDYCIDRALDGELTLSYSMDGDIEQVTATINTTYNWMALDGLLNLLTFGSASLDPGPLRASSTMRVEGEVSP